MVSEANSDQDSIDAYAVSLGAREWLEKVKPQIQL
jgi:hypothetical protein